MTPGLACVRKDARLLSEIPDTDKPLARQATGIDEYIVGKQIGQGAYATVRFGMAKESGRKVAVKLYDKYKLLDQQRRKSVWREIKLMERISHPNIVRYFDSVDTQKHVHIVMEYLGGGSLHSYLKKRSARRLDDHRARRVLSQTCAGLQYLHDRHIVHRDIKLENLLLDENGVIKIIDFGFATIVPPGKKIRVFCGTPSYMAPEIVARKEHTGHCTDIWATGVLLFAMLCGSFPFKGQTDRELYRRIAKGVFCFPEGLGVSPGARELVNRCLCVDYNRRLTIAEVVSDSWVTTYAEEAKPPPVRPHSMSISSQTTAASVRDASKADSKGSKTDSKADSKTGKMSESALLPEAHGVHEASEDGDGSPSGSKTTWVGGGIEANVPINGSEHQSPELDERLDESCRPADTAEIFKREAAERPRKRLDIPELVKHEPKLPAQSATVSPAVEEEAIAKLQRLGYAPDEIRLQLQDDSSHLYKLYFRFLRALHAWDSH
jgi:serine/threonine protein kinase